MGICKQLKYNLLSFVVKFDFINKIYVFSQLEIQTIKLFVPNISTEISHISMEISHISAGLSIRYHKNLILNQNLKCIISLI